MSKQLFYNQLKEQEKELSDELLAIQVLIKRYEADGIVSINKTTLHRKDKSITPIKKENVTFDKNWSVLDKVHYCLKQIDSGYVNDVCEVFVNYDQYFGRDKAKRACTKNLSKLFTKGVIGANKVGMKNKYFIKKEAISL